jgi:hypothetical protein
MISIAVISVGFVIAAKKQVHFCKLHLGGPYLYIKTAKFWEKCVPFDKILFIYGINIILYRSGQILFCFHLSKF